jgi:hypothetical protein
MSTSKIPVTTGKDWAAKAVAQRGKEGNVGMDEIARGTTVEMTVTFTCSYDTDSDLGKMLDEMGVDERAELMLTTIMPYLRDAVDVSNEGREDFIVGLPAQ